LITLISVLVWSAALAGIGVYTATISKDLTVNHGVGAGGSITGSKITVNTPASTTGNQQPMVFMWKVVLYLVAISKIVK
jgi:hypothetical protein